MIIIPNAGITRGVAKRPARKDRPKECQTLSDTASSWRGAKNMNPSPMNESATNVANRLAEADTMLATAPENDAPGGSLLTGTPLRRVSTSRIACSNVSRARMSRRAALASASPCSIAWAVISERSLRSITTPGGAIMIGTSEMATRTPVRDATVSWIVSIVARSYPSTPLTSMLHS